MNNNSGSSNSWQYVGQVKFSPTLRTLAGGKSFLSVTVDNGNSGMSGVMFGVLAEAFHVMTGQGNTVSLTGYINQRKDSNTGYYQNSLICQAFSVDGGSSWHTEQSLKGQQQAQYQPQQQPLQQAIQGFQQPQQQPVRTPAQQSQAFQEPAQNQQVAHLQQCQKQFQQQAPQQHQRQPMQSQPTQSRDEFLSTNQYRQQSPQGQQQQGKMADLLNNRTDPDSPVTPEAMEAQSQLYGAPAQEQQ